MNKLMRKIIASLGLHNPGEPYKVKVSDIIIPEEFKATKPRFEKMIQKRKFYRKNNRFELPPPAGLCSSGHCTDKFTGKLKGIWRRAF